MSMVNADDTSLQVGVQRVYLFTQILVLIGLIAVIMLGLLPALLAGLLVYEIVEFGASRLGRYGLDRSLGRVILFGGLTLVVLAALAMAIAGFASRLTTGPESVVVVMERMADVVDEAQTYLPQWALQYLPSNMDEWKIQAAGWLRDNARHISIVGKDIGLFLFHILFGLLIGGMVALNPAFQSPGGPLAYALHRRMIALANAFRRIVFSQIRISAINTVLTAIFLLAVEPILGDPLPLTKTMIAVTFLAGLLPIIGNLISNTMIFLIALSVSSVAAVSALIFLIVIHKLEYFINARIIGTQIRARAWEILLAMVAMEAALGIPGVVAAPIYYAYLKDELSSQKLI
jgi:predicted PurR-regulated permease PerM